MVAHNFLPHFTKPASCVGVYISMQGKEWVRCPTTADKEKWYRCIVRQLEAMHEFTGFKSMVFEVH